MVVHHSREDLATLQSEIVARLQQAGASVVGFADLSPLPEEQATGGLKSAISVGIALNPKVVAGLAAGPTTRYHAEYDRVNGALAQVTALAADMLRERRFVATRGPATVRTADGGRDTTPMPHKTVATRALARDLVTTRERRSLRPLFLERPCELHGLGDALLGCSLFHLGPVRAFERLQGTQVLPLKLPRPGDLRRGLLRLLWRRRLGPCRMGDRAFAPRLPVLLDLGLGHVLVVLAHHAEDWRCRVRAAGHGT